MLDDGAWLALREVCLRGMCAVEPPAAATLIDAGLARETARGLAATAEGRAALEQWARLPDGSDAHAIATQTYAAFLPVDRELKQIATDWQARGAAKKAALDHEDWKIVDRLTALDEKAGPFLRRLGDAVPRFAAYRPRLRDACKRIEAGEHEYLTGLLVDSYHTVWWHLHQDLLWALGIDRSDDPNQ
jgi:hypothetical protein